jgi:hypothetical protein
MFVYLFIFEMDRCACDSNEHITDQDNGMHHLDVLIENDTGNKAMNT